MVAPALPPGRHVELPGRGTTFVRELAGPPGATCLLLLHGWTATADLNWFRSYASLAQRYRVIALDHRGHGRGIRSWRPFRMEDCADDAVALLDALGVERAVPVGYSMGGAVAQLVWRRHPSRVSALVLCSTAGYFATSRDERRSFRWLTGLGALARLAPPQARQWLTEQLYLSRKAGAWEPWALREASTHDWRMVLEAGGTIGSFDAREWLGEIDVPTSVVITMRDRIVPVRRQVQLYESIPGATVHRVDGDHDSVVTLHERYVATLMQACADVVDHVP